VSDTKKKEKEKEKEKEKPYIPVSGIELQVSVCYAIMAPRRKK